MTFFTKKPLKINVFLLILFLFCSNCGKNIKKCEFFPKYGDFERKKIESTENFTDFLKSGTAYATFKCLF